MMDWMAHVPQVPLTWLLERENPSVRTFTLTELLDRDAEDEEVVEARQMVTDASYTAHILANQHPEGYWGTGEDHFSKHDTFPVVIPLSTRGAPSKWITLRALIVLKRWFGA
jgi:hypothetical protein